MKALAYYPLLGSPIGVKVGSALPRQGRKKVSYDDLHISIYVDTEQTSPPHLDDDCRDLIYIMYVTLP